MYGKLIKDIRQDKGIPLTELSIKSGIHSVYLSRMEHENIKKPSEAILAKIAKGLEIPVEDLHPLPSPANPMACRIGERLRIARKKKGITQTELAEILGIKWEVVYGYETGRFDPLAINIRLFEEMVSTLDMELAKLLYGDLGNPEPSGAKDVLERLKRACMLNNDAELARFLGVKPNTISTWKVRNSVDHGLIITKCGETIDLHWLFTGQGEAFRRTSNPIPQVVSMREVSRVLSILPKSLAFDSRNILLRCYEDSDIDLDKTHIFLVKDESMSPAIAKGDYVIFELSENVESDDVAVLSVTSPEGLVEIKLMRYKEKGGKIMLSSDNPEYPALRLDKHCKVVGRVNEIIRG